MLHQPAPIHRKAGVRREWCHRPGRRSPRVVVVAHACRRSEQGELEDVQAQQLPTTTRPFSWFGCHAETDEPPERVAEQDQGPPDGGALAAHGVSSWSGWTAVEGRRSPSTAGTRYLARGGSRSLVERLDGRARGGLVRI